MRSLEFREWWREFMHNHEKDNDNGQSMMNELKWTLNGYSTKKRISFINHLIEEKESVIATELIPKYGSSSQKRRLRMILFGNLIIARNSIENEILLISIIKTYKPIDYLLIYFFFITTSQFYSSALKELYKHDKNMFLTFFTKTIKRSETKSYSMTVFFRDSEIKDYLIKHCDRLILLKVQLLDQDIRLIN
jgi:hypothetical protein